MPPAALRRAAGGLQVSGGTLSLLTVGTAGSFRRMRGGIFRQGLQLRRGRQAAAEIVSQLLIFAPDFQKLRNPAKYCEFCRNP